MPQSRSLQSADTWIVLPAYNEDEVLRGVVAEVQSLGYSVVVVDDCSREPAAYLLRGLPISIVRHDVNLGQGAALQTGIDFALEHGAERIVTFDSDGQHAAKDIASLLAALEAGADVALGSRFMAGARVENISVTKLVTLKLAVLFTRVTTGLKITDTHNGLRALTRSAATKLRITQNRMAHASEILSEIGRLKFSYVEVPVTITYTEYSISKGQRVSNAFNILWENFTSRFRR